MSSTAASASSCRPASLTAPTKQPRAQRKRAKGQSRQRLSCVARVEQVSSTGRWEREETLTLNEAIPELAATKTCCSQSPPAPVPTQTKGGDFWLPIGVGAVVAAGAAAYGIKKIFDTPSRPYTENVGDEYDAWTREGILEYYWGEHIHLGYYSEEERAKGYKKKNFIEAKIDFVSEMLKWADVPDSPAKVLDVGCGIGGTTRLLAKHFPNAQVTGITLSPEQVKRATELAKEQGLDNANFRVMNALDMEFEKGSFDFVWACESGEHMPDKTKYVQEMTRMLKPGGRIAIATWCQRDDVEVSFTEDERDRVTFLEEEWAHPHFISKEEYVRRMEATGSLEEVETEDWAAQTGDSWRHSIWVGVWDPWVVVFNSPRIWYRTMREIVTLERWHRSFDTGLMEYGMMKAKKKVEA